MAEIELKLGGYSGSLRGIQFDGSYVLPCNETVITYHPSRRIEAMKKAKEVFSLQSGDAVVLTGGLINGKVGNTNVIKVETVK